MASKLTPNKQQQQVIDTINGPVLVIAGPGSGKTKTLIDRVINILQQPGVAPENILLATFTEKASKELMTRISNRLIEEGSKVNPNDLYIGTLHSIFLRLIKDHQEESNLEKNYRLIEPFEQKYLIYNELDRFKDIPAIEKLTKCPWEEIKGYKKWDAAEALVKYINVVSEEALDINKLMAAPDDNISALGTAAALYGEILMEKNCLDFSTVQATFLKLITDHPSVLEAIQNQIKYFMIDEYQDTNTIQEKILLLLAGKSKNICVVGDDDQGLYRFRGATIRNILQFASNFPEGECTSIYLSTNYRSHPQIVDFYNRFMKDQNWKVGNTIYRYDKDIVAYDGVPYPETGVVLKLTAQQNEQNYFKEVYDFIKHLQSVGAVTDLNQITYLCKSVKNDRVVGLMTYLEQKGIKTFSPRSDQFFNRPEVRHLMGAILALFPQVLEGTSILSYENQKAEYRSYYNEFINELEKDPVQNKGFKEWIEELQKKHRRLKESTDYAFSDLIYQMFQFPFFSHYLDTDLNASKQDLRPVYNISALTRIFARFEFLYDISILSKEHLTWTLRHLFIHYIHFVINEGMDEYDNFDETVPSGCVSFMTIHQAKGLEFPVTIVGSMNLNPTAQIDSLLSLLQSDYCGRPVYEPEDKVKFYDFYRLFYTAFSRAQNLLVLTGFALRGMPSKTFKPYWDKLPDWKDESRFDASKLKLASVKPVNLKHEYAFTSHILLYENCPLQYKFYKELEFTAQRQGSTLAGSLMHQTIEDIHKAVLRGEEHKVTEANIRLWFDSNYNQLVQANHVYLFKPQRDAILRNILNYCKGNAGRWNLREAEVDVSLVKEDFILKGTIDLVKGQGDTVEIVDFKSGDKPDVNSSEEAVQHILERYHRQLEVYAHIVEEKYGLKISKLHLHYPKDHQDPLISFEYDKRDVQKTIDSFSDTVNKIENKDFSMAGHHCTSNQCANCDFRFYCKK